MPIYRYRCADCGAQEEHLQKISDAPLETCGSCGGSLSKLMTAAAFHLKGGGWYKDLYASSKSTESAGASGGSDPAGTKSGDSSSSESGGSKAGGSDGGGSGGSSSDGSSSSSSSSSGSTGSSSPSSSSNSAA